LAGKRPWSRLGHPGIKVFSYIYQENHSNFSCPILVLLLVRPGASIPFNYLIDELLYIDITGLGKSLKDVQLISGAIPPLAHAAPPLPST
jgi:hypothetical protein